ncbi:hypothetical protein NQ314_018630 [Rhamnusium bicolor]|uniref:Pre-mRNA-processing factor 19 n=1 Tax=Rhamnusium bicolor TaxID=1586634 RepID=A0AAV8WQ73_9CUCU|nr:hypothetical protein NQ314_018630 [Rhamnusium bicolor]
MALCCAISNEVPEHPVVSPSSGAIFEKRIIEKYVQENGVDPISGKELSIDDLIEIKTPPIVKPKPPSATSIPATLKLLQDEWDAVMLYSFTQRQQLQTARQELSHALYQHDAACRVIARLNKEVTAAREALATLKPQAGITTVPQPKLQEKATVLTQERKKRGRTVPEELTTQEQLRSFRTLASLIGLHSASIPGILALDVHKSDTSKVLTGGNDKNATVFNKDTEQVVAILKGHTKKVTKVIYHPDEDLVLTGDYVLSTSEDQHWAFSDIRTGRLLTKVTDNSNVPLTTAQLHPDGLIFGTGTGDSQVKIWDLKEQSNVANFTGHSGAITTISFSENGYYLATAADDACVKLWDLRKLRNFKTLQLDEGYQIKDLCFDQSGTYLGVAGSDVRIYLCKQWQELKVFNDHTATATGVRFGKHARFIASTSMDRTLKLYGLE